METVIFEHMLNINYYYYEYRYTDRLSSDKAKFLNILESIPMFVHDKYHERITKSVRFCSSAVYYIIKKVIIKLTTEVKERR
jgi:hypothetical protein